MCGYFSATILHHEREKGGVVSEVCVRQIDQTEIDEWVMRMEKALVAFGDLFHNCIARFHHEDENDATRRIKMSQPSTNAIKTIQLTALISDLIQISTLNLCSDTDQRSPQSILGRREQHLLFDLGLVGGPVVTVSVRHSLSVPIAWHRDRKVATTKHCRDQLPITRTMCSMMSRP
jgi:hypothetical protein